MTDYRAKKEGADRMEESREVTIIPCEVVLSPSAKPPARIKDIEVPAESPDHYITIKMSKNQVRILGMFIGKLQYYEFRSKLKATQEVDVGLIREVASILSHHFGRFWG